MDDRFSPTERGFDDGRRTAKLPGITAPTLVIVGADDAGTPPARSRRIVELIDGARLVQIPDCGHSSSVKQPDVVSGLLTDFLGGQAD
ncbi:hypothetical protein MSAS_08730 [Mycobacterium saskatchewanense]|uniref:Peptidase S33 tripeptidyl aminopeptidase-like C-terminal domain-containing protein n=1 Tax=Mycobacterium saskatchewanense TaxID=220927 RepID=A0AAJ3NN96_9MYCO|nr:alpha/beta hydrolase [Mycobacterium saskatchewanense]ORW69046.1 hypothetical protein AWC23_20045 [Mycobacterium saskatchewanense]BBX61699.1 hypothetical protein MSAS_08730 [Mycobacterium saskatchewanense]